MKKTVRGESKVKQYVHEKEKRVNNPPVGLVTPESDRDLPAKNYSFDPHLDPQLIWSGKVENSDFGVDTVSLHRHERIDPITIIGRVLKKQDSEQQTLFPFFEKPENILPLREAIEFYKHDQNWSNRLIAGDSLLVMNSLLEKEGMAGKVQMIYIDPPYGIKYGSNFQPFVNKRDVRDGKDEDLTQEPEMIKAFRDTWELEIHSYLSYLRDRLLLAKELLTESGSCFVQISDENVHFVKLLMEEIFGKDNFVSIITFEKTTSFDTKTLASISDYLIWFAKNKPKMKYHQLFKDKSVGGEKSTNYDWIELVNGQCRRLSKEEIEKPWLIPKEAKIFAVGDVRSSGFSEGGSYEFEFEGKTYTPSANRHWTTSKEGMENLKKKNRLIVSGNTLMYKRYLHDFPVYEITNHWDDVRPSFQQNKIYVVQTVEKVLERCILMTTDPADLVFDPTCGSGTTSYVAEKWGRRWITCDTSRVAITLTKQRLMTAFFDYYELFHQNEGLNSGFKYKKVPHITLGSIAKNENPREEILYDQPIIDKTKIRITGPFTFEAVPSPTVKSLNTEYEKISEIDSSIARTADNRRQQDWRDELLSSGVRGKGGQKIEFSRVEPHPASQWIHAVGETKEPKPKIVAVSFGPEHSPLEQKQVALAITEAQKFVPKPELIIFTALQFDPEAAKDIDELQWPGVQVLRVQANADLLTLDLKKKRASNESFWLMGQPDAELKKQKDGKYIVEVKGFDYYNTKTGEIESGDSSKIAMWMLDTDYDEKSLYPQQV
ncbi:MAG: site-specific DNA-methyltransferase, partial [Thaumarchaeota archaeon]|nr:site-specific DNA-methyltransferase [Nitrososphaerota archaeon]